jgi:hypothetical protein
MIIMDDYVSKYYGRAKVCKILGVVLYFSYYTLIAVRLQTGETFMDECEYSSTTRRHASYVPHENVKYMAHDDLEQLALDAIAVEMRRIGR